MNPDELWDDDAAELRPMDMTDAEWEAELMRRALEED